MSIKTYREKRKFSKTPEPDFKDKTREQKKEQPGRKSAGHLRFVIQKHQATNLHYDVRLELEGVLKSWAVPKGPSMNPGDKRLAMMVEDHPWEYRNFEGRIPEGNYGAGTVIVWDEGSYHATGTRSRRESEQQLKKMFSEGDIKITFRGKKLKGDFALVKMKGKAENNWLLIKKKDSYSTDKNITDKNKSVKSGKTLEEVSAETSEGERKAVSVALPGEEEINSIIKEMEEQGAVKKAFPPFMPPMLATLTDAPFSDPKWIFEIKWDGYRAVAHLEKGEVELFSRNRKTFNRQFKPVADALNDYPFTAVFDGEIVILDVKGKSNFQALQQFQESGQGHLAYYVFDLLYFEGYELSEVPLVKRKEWLKKVMPRKVNVLYSDHVEEQGKEFYKAASGMQLEGIIAKKANGGYYSGKRSKEWLKLKIIQQQEFVIGGFTSPKNSREHFGALLIGYYQDNKLQFAGKVGGGFSSSLLKDVFSKLEPLVSGKNPFESVPMSIQRGTSWVKPVLVAEVKFTEWTSEGQLRHPVFLGLREDKKPKEVKKEVTRVHSEEVVHEPEASRGKKSVKAGDKKMITAGRRKIAVSNPGKIFWPEEGITKLDVVEYYRKVAKYMLPYLKNRPQSLNRHPNGIQGNNFYQKDMLKAHLPEWIKTVKVASESRGKAIHYMLCQDEATLLYMANLGCIEINPWLSSLPELDKPDFMVIDLDPEDIDFKYVIETALVVKEVLDEAGATSVCKTSGSTGMHVCVPMGAGYTYDQVVKFARLIAGIAHQRFRKYTSIERGPSKRQKKVYIDFLQNRKNQTIAAPYSLRPKPGATASAPLKWEEVNENLKMEDFNIHNMQDRVQKVGDLWKPVLGKGIDMLKCLAKLEKME